jgi:hypothetical protein
MLNSAQILTQVGMSFVVLVLFAVLVVSVVEPFPVMHATTVAVSVNFLLVAVPHSVLSVALAEPKPRHKGLVAVRGTLVQRVAVVR